MYATAAQQTEIANRAYAQSGLSPWAASRGCWGGKVTTNGPTVPKHASPVTAPAVPLPHSTPKHAAPDTQVPPKASGASESYLVAAGDTLAGIADAQHVKGGWQAIFDANRDTLADPNVINIGAHLNIPVSVTNQADITSTPETTDILTGLITPAVP